MHEDQAVPVGPVDELGLEECAYIRVWNSEAERYAGYRGFCHFYNHHRSHGSLGWSTPMATLTSLARNNLPGLHSQTGGLAQSEWAPEAGKDSLLLVDRIDGPLLGTVAHPTEPQNSEIVEPVDHLVGLTRHPALGRVALSGIPQRERRPTSSGRGGSVSEDHLLTQLPLPVRPAHLPVAAWCPGLSGARNHRIESRGSHPHARIRVGLRVTTTLDSPGWSILRRSVPYLAATWSAKA